MVILITGTTGIAAATAELARARGHQVHTAGLPQNDLAKPGEAETVLGQCVQLYGRLDALFHVAGASGRGYGDGPVDKCTDQGWRFTLDANLTSAFHASRAAVRQMLRQPVDPHGQRGNLLLMSSVLATHPENEHFATHAYAAAKGGILSMGRAMAAQYASQGIRVNVIAPGLVRSSPGASAAQSPEMMVMMKSRQPLAGDLIDASEVAKAALFLLTDESRFITGEFIAVDAGWSVS